MLEGYVKKYHEFHSIYALCEEEMYEDIDDEIMFHIQETGAYVPIEKHNETVQFEGDCVSMVQYSIRKGLEKFGKRGEAAVKKELQSLIDMEVFEPKLISDLTPDQLRGAIESLTFMGEKADGTVKARTCANPKRRKYKFNILTIINTTSPTVSNNTLYLMLDAPEPEKER